MTNLIIEFEAHLNIAIRKEHNIIFTDVSDDIAYFIRHNEFDNLWYGTAMLADGNFIIRSGGTLENLYEAIESSLMGLLYEKFDNARCTADVNSNEFGLAKRMAYTVQCADRLISANYTNNKLESVNEDLLPEPEPLVKRDYELVAFLYGYELPDSVYDDLYDFMDYDTYLGEFFFEYQGEYFRVGDFLDTKNKWYSVCNIHDFWDGVMGIHGTNLLLHLLPDYEWAIVCFDDIDNE